MYAKSITPGKVTKSIARLDVMLVQREAQEPRRRHLGASVLGEECDRKLWYGFRWMGREVFGGRMLRLFDRGHNTEGRFVEYLRLLGAQVWEVDTTSNEQFRITFSDGHGGGSCDAVALGGIHEIPKDTPYVCEFKSHNDKQFKKLREEGLCSAKYTHFAQMQTYMHGLRLKCGLYMAMNKNDDDMHWEVVPYQQDLAEKLMHRADRIIHATKPPARISKTPSWWQCKFCAHTSACHYGSPVDKNCRSCASAKPSADGQWVCAKSMTAIHKNPEKGCTSYTPFPQ